MNHLEIKAKCVQEDLFKVRYIALNQQKVNKQRGSPYNGISSIYCRMLGLGSRQQIFAEIRTVGPLKQVERRPTTFSVSPQLCLPETGIPGQQSGKQQNMEDSPKLARGGYSIIEWNI